MMRSVLIVTLAWVAMSAVACIVPRDSARDHSRVQGGDSLDSPESSPEVLLPRVRAILAGTQPAYNDYATGRFERFYSVWTADSKRRIDKETFLDRARSCDRRLANIETIRAGWNADGTWTVHWRVGRRTGEDLWRFDEHVWRFVATDGKDSVLACRGD